MDNDVTISLHLLQFIHFVTDNNISYIILPVSHIHWLYGSENLITWVQYSMNGVLLQKTLIMIYLTTYTFESEMLVMRISTEVTFFTEWS